MKFVLQIQLTKDLRISSDIGSCLEQVAADLRDLTDSGEGAPLRPGDVGNIYDASAVKQVGVWRVT